MTNVCWSSNRLTYLSGHTPGCVPTRNGACCNRSRLLISQRRSTRMCARAPDVDVAVVGGGPGGLAAAAAIRSALGTDAKVKVFESLKGYKLQGSGVLMQPNVQRALEAIHPTLFDKFKTHGLPLWGSQHLNLEGKHTRDVPPEISPEIAALRSHYGRAPFFLGWHEIRHLLFDFVPTDIVEFDKQINHYTEDDEGVTLHFDHGQPSVRAKVVVGADGYFSRVRNQCLDDGPPDFVGSVMWRARTPWLPGMQDPDDDRPPSRWWRSDETGTFSKPFAVVFKMGTLKDTKHRAWTWVLSAPVDYVKAAGVEFDPEARTIKSVQGGTGHASSALENAIKVFGSFPAELLGILQATEPSTVTQHGLYMRNLTPVSPLEQDMLPRVEEDAKPQSAGHQEDEEDPQTATLASASDQKLEEVGRDEGQGQGGKQGQGQGQGQVQGQGWGRGRVTLLGDAAHATLPNGQGLALAVEDAVVLAWHLRQKGIGPAALRSYEQEQLKRVTIMHSKGTDAASAEDKEANVYKPYFRPLWQSSEDDAAAKTCIVDFA